MFKEAFLAGGPQECDKCFVDLLALEPDHFYVLVSHLEVNEILDEFLVHFQIGIHLQLVRVIGIVCIAEPVVEEKELIAPVPIAVENLVSDINR